jgi:mannose/cellobiose epimerase-like protein (N-acyl-D-glucosamine 2-epimerase family)
MPRKGSKVKRIWDQLETLLAASALAEEGESDAARAIVRHAR